MAPKSECADLVLLDFSTLLQLPHLWHYTQAGAIGAIGAIGLWCVNKRDLENNILVRTSEPNDLNGQKKELSSASPATLKDADKSATGPTFSKLLKKVQVFHIRCTNWMNS